MNKNIVKNYIYNLSYQILILILPVLTTPYISRVLGVENIGIYSYTLSISEYFIIFGLLGTNLYGQREIAYNQKNKNKYSKVFWEIFILRIITMFFSMVIYMCTFVKHGQYSVFFKILFIVLIANCFDISWFFQGLEQFKKTVFRNICIKLISVILIFVLVKTPSDLYLYFWIYVISCLVGNISLYVCLPRILVKTNVRQLNIIKHLKPTLIMFVPQIAMQVYTLLDRTMLGSIIIDKSEVGYYDQSQKIIKMLLAVVTSLGPVMLSRISNTVANGKKENIIQYLYKSFNVIFLFAFPIIFGVIAVSPDFVPLFFGDGYDKVILLLDIASPIILFIGLSSVTGMQYLLPFKKQKEYTYSIICGAIINFFINCLVIKKYMSIGASIGTVVAEFVVVAIQFYFIKKDFNLFKILKLSLKYFISSVIMFLVCLVIRRFINENIISLVTQCIVGGVIYICSLIIMKDNLIYESLNKMRNEVYS